MNIQEQVQLALNNIVESGKIEEIVAKNIEKTIESLLHDSLREYSDFGRQLKEVVNSSLQINLDQVSTLGYQQIVVDIVNEKLKSAVLENISKPIEDRLGEILAPFEKRNYKLSEIIQKYKEHEWSDYDDEGEISFHLEYSDYGGAYVSFDKWHDKEARSCEYRLNISKEGALWMFEIKDYRPTKGDLRASSIHGAFDHFIFNLYASQSPIEIDEDEVETYWSRDDY